jgi:hypothetical protein
MQQRIKQRVHASTAESIKHFPRGQSKLPTKNENEAISRLKNILLKINLYFIPL